MTYFRARQYTFVFTLVRQESPKAVLARRNPVLHLHVVIAVLPHTPIVPVHALALHNYNHNATQ